jgi:hypothetical protein
MVLLSGVLVLLTLGLLVAGQRAGGIALTYLAIAVGLGAVAAVTVAVRRHRDDPPQ